MSAKSEPTSHHQKHVKRPDVHIAFKVFSPQVSRAGIPILLLHGVTFDKETWDDCAQNIADRTGSLVYSLDARNHGDSGWTQTMGYDVMADDVVHFMDTQNIPKVTIVGHSMGGKTGMSFALKYPDRLECLIIEDISARSPPESKTGVDYYMRQLKDVLTKIPITTELEEAKRLAASYLSGGQAAANKRLEENSLTASVWDGRDLPLKRNSSGRFEWKTNLDILAEAYQNGKWAPVSSTGRYDGPVLSIYGTKSPFKVLDDKPEFLKQFPKTMYQPIQDGGHSLHIGYQEIFTGLVCDFILQQRIDSLSSNSTTSGM